MSNYPVDVTIYLASMRDAIEDPQMASGLEEEFGVTDFEKFVPLILEEIELQSLDNYNEHGIAQLTEDQFFSCLEKGVVQYFLDELVAEGKIEAIVDVDDMCVKYQTTERAVAQNLINQIHLN